MSWMKECESPRHQAADRDDPDSDGHRPPLAEPVSQPPGGQRSHYPHQRERADNAGRRGSADAELTCERRDARRDDPVAERDRERDRAEYRYLARQSTVNPPSRTRHIRHSASRL
jgi:hypothetical protein